jgi:hypothetical protein
VNAYHIFHNILQYEGKDEFSMKADDLMERITTVLRYDPEWIEKNTTHPYDSVMPDDWAEPESSALALEQKKSCDVY